MAEGSLMMTWLPRVAIVGAALLPLAAAAQQPAPPPAAQAPAPAPAPAPVPAESGEWAKLPRMQLEHQFAGPLQDTIVQRWRDPTDGTLCYLYLPITAAHSSPTVSGFVQYGANTIGSISCIAPSAAAPKRSPASAPR
jgi:hypothetical protein